MFLRSTVILINLLGLVYGFSRGPPPSACKTMKPGAPHGKNQVTVRDKRNPPFDFIAVKVDDGKYEVMIMAKKDVTFRGFMIMAEIDGERGYGYFLPEDSFKEMLKPLDCDSQPCSDKDLCGGNANALAHSTGEAKTAISGYWFVPDNIADDGAEVTFVATIVGSNNEDEGSVWWENVRSETYPLL